MRVTAKEVRIEQIGTDLWLHPETPPEENMGHWLQQFYANSAELPDDFLANKQDPAS